MDTFSLQYILDNLFPQLYGIVCAKDQLIYVKPKRGCYIVNTDIISKPGKHWVLLYFNHNICCYFDSYGSFNNIEKEIINFININSTKLLRNKQRFQSDSSQLCGVYCLYVLYAILYYNYSFSYTINNTFNSYNWLSNDMHLTTWFQQFYKHLRLQHSTGKHLRLRNSSECQQCTSKM